MCEVVVENKVRILLSGASSIVMQNPSDGVIAEEARQSGGLLQNSPPLSLECALAESYVGAWRACGQLVCDFPP